MRAVGPALSSVSKDSLSGRGQPTGNLCPSSSPASWPHRPQGCCFLPSCALARPDPSLRPPFQFCRSSVLCWPPVILLASPGSWCWTGAVGGGVHSRERSSGPECRRCKRESGIHMHHVLCEDSPARLVPHCPVAALRHRSHHQAGVSHS